jgi:pilus assembly protein CpaB
MSRNKVVIIITVAALFFAGIAAWQASEFLGKNQGKDLQYQGIIIAASALPVGVKINDPAQLKLSSWPKDSLPQGSFVDPAVLIGRIPVHPISAGEPVSESKLLPVGATSIMAYTVPEGHRAITVSVNEVAGVAGFLNPQNKVDVVVTMPLPNSPESISKIILQNVPILATGQIMEQREGKPVVVTTVTLDVTPEDAEKLALAASKGQLQMLLRNISDSGKVVSGGANISKVLGSVPTRSKAAVAHSGSRPAPVPQAWVIRGLTTGDK